MQGYTRLYVLPDIPVQGYRSVRTVRRTSVGLQCRVTPACTYCPTYQCRVTRLYVLPDVLVQGYRSVRTVRRTSAALQCRVTRLYVLPDVLVQGYRSVRTVRRISAGVLSDVPVQGYRSVRTVRRTNAELPACTVRTVRRTSAGYPPLRQLYSDFRDVCNGVCTSRRLQQLKLILAWHSRHTDVPGERG